MAATEKARNAAQEFGVQKNLNASDEYEIDLLELLYRLLENWKWIIAAALIGAIAFGVYTVMFITPTYQATSKLYVMNSSDSAINLSDLQIGSYLTSDYQEVFKTWEVHEMVIENLNLDYSYSQLQGMLSVSNPTDTRVLYITVTSADPQLAMSIANEYASVAKKYISETMVTEEPNIFSAALEPVAPVAPSKTKNVMMGFLLGAFIAAAIVVIRFITDDKIKTAEDIRRYVDLPTLAIVPVLEGSNSKKDKASASKQRR
ncbi:MAG: Wzz/FepE/Etk N-terminal domain-containing protein [Clostridia bacterium]|nr:Wzz/FepE/Etk N-terminal domain-containing protein [Clostridia bacterium]